MFGTGEHGAFIVPYNKNCSSEESLAREKHYMEPFEHNVAPAEGHEIRVAASLMHFSKQMETIIESLDPVKIVRLGGAGNKAVHIALNEVDTYMHPSPGLRYWDLCAPESLAKAMGGYAENLYQERLTYPVSGDTKIRGLILSKNPPMYSEIKKRMGEVLENIRTTVKL